MWFWKFLQHIFLMERLSIMTDTTRTVAQNTPQSIQPPAIITKTPLTIDQDGNQTQILDTARDLSGTTAVVNKPSPQYTDLAGVRPLRDVAGELEGAIADLESLSTPTGADAYFQEWLREKEKPLRARADADRKGRAEAIAVQITRLESELKVSCDALMRMSQSVRSSITSPGRQS